MSLVIDISVSRIDYLLTVQAQRTEDRTESRDVYTYQVSISGPLTARLGETRLGLRAKPKLVADPRGGYHRGLSLRGRR